jgi:glyoxylase-like metal-dependent hydrolase (beta-lactamase superfamily II)
MHVAPGVEMLELDAELMNGPGVLCPALIWDRQNAVLVDAGLPGMAPQFIEAIENSGVSPAKLSRIIVTHHDLDHIGSLGELQKKLSQRIEVLSHPGEVPYIQGERTPIKMTPERMAEMQELMKSLPEERRRAMQTMNEALKNQKVKVDRTVVDGEMLPYCGGIQVIHVPGHTPGHLCLYLPSVKTLVTGDALFVENGSLVLAPPFSNADTRMALESLKKLTRYDIQNVICYHGGLYREAPKRRIEELTSAKGGTQEA